MDCIFCKIIDGEISSYTIYEDEIVKVFLDIHPDTNGHVLIIPKKHYLDIMDIDTNTLCHILDVAKKIGKLLEEKLNIKGLTLIQNNGSAQLIKHFHLHLKPCYGEEKELKPVEEIYNILTK